jgi:hypothetical protein
MVHSGMGLETKQRQNRPRSCPHGGPYLQVRALHTRASGRSRPQRPEQSGRLGGVRSGELQRLRR